MKDLKKNYFPFFKKILPTFILVLIVFAFFWKVFFRGQVPFPGDFVVGVYYPWLDYKWGFATGVPVKNPITTDVPSFTYPMQTYAMELLKEGILPLWNPLILAGTPLLANFQSAPFSIVNVVYFLTDAASAWSIEIILQHVFAAVFLYLLLRYWKVSKQGSILGGAIYAFAGFNLIWSQWNGHTLSAAFIPLIFLFEDKWLKEGKVRSLVGLSFAFALQILSGYPQVVIYTILGAGILYLFRIKETKDLFKKTIFLFIFGVLSLGLTAFQLLPGRELLSFSQRAVEPHPFEWAFLPFKKIITFIAPDYFGNHATKNYWGPQDYTSNTGMVGVVGFVLAFLSVKLFSKKKEVLFLLFLAVFSLVLAFPTPLSIFLWKGGFLGLNAASAHRSLILWNLSVALLSGFGFDLLKTKIGLKTKILVLIPAFLILAGFGIYAFNIQQTVGLRNLILPSGVFILTSLILVFKPNLRYLFIPLAILELFYFGWKFTPFFPKDIIYPTTPVLDFLMAQKKPFRVTGDRVIPINMKMPYGLESLEGYDAVYPLRISQFLAAINGGRSGTDPLGRYGTVDNDTSRFLDLVNTKYYLTHKLDKKGNPSTEGTINSRFDSERFKIAFEDKSVAVLESKSVMPRSFFVSEWEVINDDSKIIARLLDPNFDFSKKVILEEKPSENTLGFIFTSDTFYPGWKAYVDGKETKIYRADFAFRAVPVSSKDSKVEYSYQPESFYNGLKISLVSLLLLILLLPFARRYTRA